MGGAREAMTTVASKARTALSPTKSNATSGKAVASADRHAWAAHRSSPA